MGYGGESVILSKFIIKFNTCLLLMYPKIVKLRIFGCICYFVTYNDVSTKLNQQL